MHNIIKAYLWEVLNGIESYLSLFMKRSSMHATESTEKVNSKISNKTHQIYYMVTKQSIEHKGIYL